MGKTMDVDESSPGAGTKVTYLLPVIRGIQK